MYKSRFWLWFLIGAIYLGITFGFPIVKQHIDDYSKMPKTATVTSDDNNIRRGLDERKISRTTLHSASVNADIIVNVGKNKTDGYIQQGFYSPIVAIVTDSNGDQLFTDIGGSNRYVRILNLKEVIGGFLEDKKFSECYTSSSKGDLSSDLVQLAVDTDYEKEIKTTLLISLSGHTNVTKEDAEKYMPTVNAVWDKAQKLDDVDIILSDTKSVGDLLILTTENKAINNATNLKALSLTNTVFVDYTAEYKEGLEYIVKDEYFMKHSGLRRDGVDKYTDGELFCHSDWTIMGLHNTDIDYSILEIKSQTEQNVQSVINEISDEKNNNNQNNESTSESVDDNKEEITEENNEEIDNQSGNDESENENISEESEQTSESQEKNNDSSGDNFATISLVILFIFCLLFVVFLFIES